MRLKIDGISVERRTRRPLRATRAFAKHHMALFRSASFSGRAPELEGGVGGGAGEYQLLAQSVSYPASRPGSALAS